MANSMVCSCISMWGDVSMVNKHFWLDDKLNNKHKKTKGVHSCLYFHNLQLYRIFNVRALETLRYGLCNPLYELLFADRRSGRH